MTIEQQGPEQEPGEWTDPRYAEVVDYYRDVRIEAASRGGGACTNCHGNGVIVMQHEGKPFSAACSFCIASLG